MSTPLETKVVGFLCNWCSYAGADQAGGAQKAYPDSFKIIRVMCSGRVEPEFVLEAFRKGATGVVILACHPGDCHYKTGNIIATSRYQLLKRLLCQLGIDEKRFVMEYISASEGEHFVDVITKTVRSLEMMQETALA